MFFPLEFRTLDVYYALPPPHFMSCWDNYLTVLNGGEKQFVNRCKSEKRKVEFALGRFLLKSALAFHLEVKPAEIEFKKNQFGKLYLSQEWENEKNGEIRFNLSHSGGVIVCAFALGCEVGVDVERKERNFSDIAASFFSPEERGFISSQPVETQNQAACRIWTMKEAHVKAKGVGIVDFFQHFNVIQPESNYFYHSFEPTPEYIASAAVEKKHNDVEFKIRVKQIIWPDIGLIHIMREDKW